MTASGCFVQAKREHAEGEGVMKSYNPDPNLPDDPSIDQVRFPLRIKWALAAAGLKTVGHVRKSSDAVLLSIQNLGQSSVTRVRNELGHADRNSRSTNAEGDQEGRH
jgi:DNA-directed RNA polymerase alpha subunit